MELDLYPVDLILSRKAERGFFGLGNWKKTYSSDFTVNCGFDVADLDPVKLLKTLLMTCQNPSTWELVKGITQNLFDATKGKRKTIYSDDNDFGITKYIVMLDLFPLELMNPSMNTLFRYLLGGDRGEYGDNTMSNIWKPGKVWPLKYITSIREELSFHVQNAVKLCEKKRREDHMKGLREKFLGTYFKPAPQICVRDIGLDRFVNCIRDGNDILYEKRFNEVYAVLFDRPRIVEGANIPCSGCFIQTHLGEEMKCKLHGYVIVQPAPKPSAPPAELFPEYLAPPKY